MKEDYAFTLGYCNIIIAIHDHCIYAAHLYCLFFWQKILAHRVFINGGASIKIGSRSESYLLGLMQLTTYLNFLLETLWVEILSAEQQQQKQQQQSLFSGGFGGLVLLPLLPKQILFEPPQPGGGGGRVVQALRLVGGRGGGVPFFAT